MNDTTITREQAISDLTFLLTEQYGDLSRLLHHEAAKRLRAFILAQPVAVAGEAAGGELFAWYRRQPRCWDVVIEQDFDERPDPSEMLAKGWFPLFTAPALIVKLRGLAEELLGYVRDLRADGAYSCCAGGYEQAASRITEILSRYPEQS